MRKKLNQWANFGKLANWLIILAFGLAIIFSIISCADEFYFGKTHEEIQVELSKQMFAVDSLFNQIQYMLDSANVNTDEVWQD